MGPANQDRVYFESQVAESYEDWFECNLAACMLQATMRSIPIATCVGLESPVKNQSLHAGLESPAGVGKPCQKSEFTCRVGKPSSNLYLQNPRGGGASLHPTEATMEEVHWKHRNATTSCGQEPCAAYICVFQYVFWVMVPMPFSPGSGHHPQDLGKAQDLWPESLQRIQKEPKFRFNNGILEVG